MTKAEQSLRVKQLNPNIVGMHVREHTSLLLSPAIRGHAGHVRSGNPAVLSASLLSAVFRPCRP